MKKSMTDEAVCCKSTSEFVVLDICRQLPKAPCGKNFLYVIRVLDQKLVGTVRLKNITATSVAKAFLKTRY